MARPYIGGTSAMIETPTASQTLSAADSGKVFVIGTDALTFTLPSTAQGLEYTFVNSGADAGVAINISPASADAIHGTTCASTNVVLGGVDNKDLINTKGTATTGDSCKLIGDGTVGWYMVSCTGIWASES
tara:strand:- start:243 stop:635 length:393 start_codon:yes stop_codon:yes gene_type:complete